MSKSGPADRSAAPAAGGDDFASQALKRRQGFVGELTSFLMNNKKWWLGPIVLVLLLVSFLVILAGTSIAPFIYTLF